MDNIPIDKDITFNLGGEHTPQFTGYYKPKSFDPGGYRETGAEMQNWFCDF